MVEGDLWVLGDRDVTSCVWSFVGKARAWVWRMRRVRMVGRCMADDLLEGGLRSGRCGCEVNLETVPCDRYQLRFISRCYYPCRSCKAKYRSNSTLNTVLG